MNPSDGEKLARLPQWAQREIERLRRELASQQARIAELTAGPENSDTVADPYAAMHSPARKPFPLGNGTTVQFKMGPDASNDLHAAVIDRGQGRVLEVRSPGGSGGRMAVRPVASNVVQIAMDARD